MRGKYPEKLGFSLVKPTLEIRKEIFAYQTQKRIFHILGETPELPARGKIVLGKCDI